MAPRIVIVTFASAQILDVTGPAEVFSSASRIGAGATYRIEIVSSGGGTVEATCGMRFASDEIGSIRGSIDTLIIAGGQGTFDAIADDRLLHHVARLARRARRVCSVCSGAFLLARCGLLDGRRATTHWQWCEELARRFPLVTVEPDPIFVRDGNVWTSAGVTAGMDLSLALIADDHGQAAATTVARNLVLYVQRPGGQAQFSAQLSAQRAERTSIRDLQTWMAGHLDGDLCVSALAKRVHLSERQFARVFLAETASTPADHVGALRVEEACRLLTLTGHSVDRIAQLCGFGTVETLQRTFRRRLGTPPGNYRRHFRVSESTPLARQVVRERDLFELDDSQSRRRDSNHADPSRCP